MNSELISMAGESKRKTSFIDNSRLWKDKCHCPCHKKNDKSCKLCSCHRLLDWNELEWSDED